MESGWKKPSQIFSMMCVKGELFAVACAGNLMEMKGEWGRVPLSAMANMQSSDLYKAWSEVKKDFNMIVSRPLI